MIRFRFFAILTVLSISTPALSQEHLLSDRNGDGILEVAAFGDSITYGVGDSAFPAAGGYIVRAGVLAGIATTNFGLPGEEALVGGQYRIAQVLSSSSADIVVMMEGTNDAVHQASTRELKSGLQRMLNITHALGKQAVIMTLPPPCCDRGSLAPFTTSYSAAIRELASSNEVPLTDLEQVWSTTCVNKSECELYNLPEGLHPNSLGYDVIAQSLLGTLMGIDLLVPGGAAQLEAALGLEPGSIMVQPIMQEIP
ncbi:MAG: SGNH/GDSL hydrolase family protein [Deltaproteobacteria bacterium]|nr:SGNH/GDSL hydrolase family protein [Deltaproteobacteria bacterium]